MTIRYPTQPCRYCGVRTTSPKLIEHGVTHGDCGFCCPTCYPLRAVAVLEAADAGQLAVHEPVAKAAPYLLDYTITAPDGVWVFRVFDDVDSWDYLDKVVAPDGTEWDFADAIAEGKADEAGIPWYGSGPVGALIHWTPSGKAWRERWRWPYGPAAPQAGRDRS